MKVAIVYDRVNKFGGAERVLLTLHEIFPNAPLFTSLYDKKNAKWAKAFPKVKTSFLNKVKFFQNKHEFLAPLMPLAFSLFNFDEYDLVVSVTSEFAKNIRVKNKHICYCLTPTRYLWSHQDEYFGNKISRTLFSLLINYLKIIDKKAAKKPGVIIAISTVVQKRIKKYYNRDSKIIFPPVNSNFSKTNDWLVSEPLEGVSFKNLKVKNYFLIVSRLVSYKKVDLAIKAFNNLNLPLVIIGTGREEKKLKKIANKNIHFAGFIDEKKLKEFYKNTKALIFPQEEDFGITAVEAQRFGVPVIAYKKGGVLDTIIDHKTGVFFTKQSMSSLKKAIEEFNNTTIDPKDCIKNSKKFSKEKFKKEFLHIVKNL